MTLVRRYSARANALNMRDLTYKDDVGTNIFARTTALNMRDLGFRADDAGTNIFA